LNGGGITIGPDGAIYVGDVGEERIHKFDRDGNWKQTYGGSGTTIGLIHDPNPLAFDSQQNIIVTESISQRIRKFTKDWQPVTIENWQPLTDTRPIGVAVDRNDDDSVYVAGIPSGTSRDARLFKFDNVGNILWSKVFTEGSSYISSLLVSDGIIYLAQSNMNRFVMLDRNGNILGFWGVPDTSQNKISYIYSMGFDKTDQLYLLDGISNQRLMRVKDEQIRNVWNPLQIGNVFSSKFAVDSRDNITTHLYFLDFEPQSPYTFSKISRISIVGDQVTEVKKYGSLGSGDGQFRNPSDIAITADGRLLVSDSGNNRLQLLALTNDGLGLTTVTSVSVPGISSIAIGVEGQAYALKSNIVAKFIVSGNTISETGILSGTEAIEADHIATDRDGNIYVSLRGNEYTRVFDKHGNLITKLGIGATRTHAFSNWSILAFDSHNNLFLVDQNYTSLVRRYRPATVTRPTATFTRVSENVSALQPNDVMTMTLQGQVGDVSRTITEYELSFHSWYYSRTITAMIPSGTPQEIVIAATDVFTHNQRMSLRVKDSAGEWSLPVMYSEFVYRAPVPSRPALRTATPLPPGVPTPTRTPSPTTGPKPSCIRPNYLVMAYVSADNNVDGIQLEKQFIATRKRLENPRATNSCAVFAMQVDGPATITTTDTSDAFAGTVRWHGALGSKLQEDWIGEKEMNNPRTLIEFIQWAQKKYDAEHYYLIIADHGQGILGTLWDHTSNPAAPSSSFMRISELGSALNSSEIVPLDIVHLDACSMALFDVSYQLRAVTKYFIASQYLGWSFFAYDEFIAQINDAILPKELAKGVVQRYASLAEGFHLPYTLAVYDQTQAESIKTSLNTLALELKSWASDDPVRIRQLEEIRYRSQLLNSNPDRVNKPSDLYVDMRNWAVEISNTFTNSLTQGNIHTAALDLVQALTQSEGGNGYMIINRTSQDRFSLPREHCPASVTDCSIHLAEASGVSVYYPPETFSLSPIARISQSASSDSMDANTPTLAGVYTEYVNSRTLDLTQASFWDDFLKVVLIPKSKDAPIDPLPPLQPPRIYLPLIMR
jgi:hypothetical protein